MLWSIAAVAQTQQTPASGSEREKLPQVLLLGDSISLGYEQGVRELLDGRAIVHHPPENCQSTTYGLEKIDEWLREGDWDVIHFNWGIWDAHRLEYDQLRTTPEQYEKNLRELTARLKRSGAKLIWASTTPMKTVHAEGIWVEGSDIPLRNEIARRVMDENEIPIDDLYVGMMSQLDRFLSDDGCHFTPEGYASLAQAVAANVMQTLGKELQPEAMQGELNETHP